MESSRLLGVTLYRIPEELEAAIEAYENSDTEEDASVIAERIAMLEASATEAIDRTWKTITTLERLADIANAEASILKSMAAKRHLAARWLKHGLIRYMDTCGIAKTKIPQGTVYIGTSRPSFQPIVDIELLPPELTKTKTEVSVNVDAARAYIEANPTQELFTTQRTRFIACNRAGVKKDKEDEE